MFVNKHVVSEDIFNQGGDGSVFYSANRFEFGKSFVIRAERDFRVFSGIILGENGHLEYRFKPRSVMNEWNWEYTDNSTFLCAFQ